MNNKPIIFLFIVSYLITYFPTFGNKCYDPIACLNQIKHTTSGIEQQLIQILDGLSTNVTQPGPYPNSTNTIITLFKEVKKLVSQIRTSVDSFDGNENTLIYKLTLYMKLYPHAVSTRCIDPTCRRICILEHRGQNLFETTETLPLFIRNTFMDLYMFDGFRSCCNSQVYNINGVISCTSLEELNGEGGPTELLGSHHQSFHRDAAVINNDNTNGHIICPCNSEIYYYRDEVICNLGDSSNMCIFCSNGEKHYVKSPYTGKHLCSGH